MPEGIPMSNFFTKHFGAIVFGTIINIPSLVKGAIWITDWLSRFDYWNTHGRDIPGISVMIGFLTDPPPWTVFLTSAAAVGVILWDVRRQNGLESTPADNLNRRFFIGFYSFCVTIVVVVWVPAWPLYFPAQAKPAPIPAPAPMPIATPKPPPPPPPWVSQDEIDQQRKLGRTLLVYSPQEFAALSVAGQNLHVYENKWVKIDYPITRLPAIEPIDKKEYYVVYVQVETGGYSAVNRYMAVYFDPKKWADQLLNVRSGTKLKALCQFMGFERRLLNNFNFDIQLGYNCELL
jgi:hypothetical protein